LLEILTQGERSVEALSRHSGLSVANTSHHLQALREARLVEARKEGLFVYYRLSSPEVFGVVHMIRRLGEQHIAEVERVMQSYFGRRDQLEPVSREELLARVKTGTVLVLDVRPAEEHRAGIVAYCRGPYCVMSYDAVDALRARGRRARRLVDGFPEWRAAGLPVAVGDTAS